MFWVYHIYHTTFARQGGGWWSGATHDSKMTTHPGHDGTHQVRPVTTRTHPGHVLDIPN